MVLLDNYSNPRSAHLVFTLMQQKPHICILEVYPTSNTWYCSWSELWREGSLGADRLTRQLQPSLRMRAEG